MTVIGVMTGPNYFSPNHDESTIEVFESVGAAVEALNDRAMANGRRVIDYKTLDGEEHAVYMPGIDEGTTLHLAMLHTEPGDFMVEEALVAVHNGMYDYTATVTDKGDILLEAVSV